MYIIQYNNIYIFPRFGSYSVVHVPPPSCAYLLVVCYAFRIIYFSTVQSPRGEIKSKKASNPVSVRGPVLAQRGGYMVFAFRFYYCILLGGKGVDIRLPYLRGFCIPSKQYILYQTYPKQLYPFCLPASSVQPGKYINGILGVRGESNNSCFLKYFLFKNILK